MNGRHAVTLGALGPSEIRTDRIQNTNDQRANAECGGGELVICEQTGRTRIQESNSS